MSGERFLGRRDVLLMTSISRGTLYALMLRGEFPRPIRVSAGRVAWLLSEVASWMAARVEASRQGAR